MSDDVAAAFEAGIERGVSASMIEAPPGDYVTVAGFILSQLHELPKPGDHVSWSGWRFEVVDMDGRRIDAVLAQRKSEH